MSTDMKSKVVKILVVVALVVGGYAYGRHSAPTTVVTTEKTVTTVDTDKIMNELAQLNQRIDQLQTIAQQTQVHVVRVTEKDPNGAVKTTVTTDKTSKTDTQTKTETVAQATTQTQTQEKQQIQQADVITKTVTTGSASKPSWSLTLQPGFEFGEALGLGSGGSYNLLSKALPMAPRMMANIGVEHRFIGPLFIGAWANTRLDAGLSLRLEW